MSGRKWGSRASPLLRDFGVNYLLREARVVSAEPGGIPLPPPLFAVWQARLRPGVRMLAAAGAGALAGAGAECGYIGARFGQSVVEFHRGWSIGLELRLGDLRALDVLRPGDQLGAGSDYIAGGAAAWIAAYGGRGVAILTGEKRVARRRWGGVGERRHDSDRAVHQERS